MKSFYAHTQVIIWAQLVATFRVPATIFGQKLLPTAAGKKVLATRYSLGVQQKTHSAQAN